MKPVNFKKRAVAGSCRAMRCQEREQLYEFETPDPKLGTVLLCESHWRRAQEHKQKPEAVGPSAPEMVVTSETLGEPIVEDFIPDEPGLVVDGVHTHVYTGTASDEPAQTKVAVLHGPVLALVEPMRAEYEGMATTLQSVVIENQDQVDMAGQLLTQVKGKLKTLDTQRKDITGPMRKAEKAVNNLFRPAIDAAKAVEAMLKAGIAGFVEAQQKAQVAALEAGQHEAALAIAQPTMPSGVSTRTIWKFRYTNVDLIPRKYWVIDSAALQAEVNANKGNTAIPGIEAYPDTSISASAS